MRPGMERQERRQEGQGGIPDGLLVGLLAFLLGVTVMVWSATGLAGWFARGAWPHGVRISSTPVAMRHLITEPHDITSAWPDTPPDQLPGYGLFWGLFISELMVLFVLTVFAIGTVARWKAVRARRKAEAATGTPHGDGAVGPHEDLAVGPHGATTGRPQGAVPGVAAGSLTAGAPHSFPYPAAAPAAAPLPEHLGTRPPTPATGPVPSTAGVEQALPVAPALAAPGTPDPPVPGPPRAPSVVLGGPDIRHPVAAQAVRDAEGPVLVITSSPALWSETKDARAKLGPVLLYDPSHLCDTPARLHWSPSAGCEDKATAAARAVALLAPVRPTARIDEAVADVAETLLRSYLHAAAIEGRTIRHIHRWAQGTQVQEAVRALRTNPKASSGAAGELEAALTSHPERRDVAQELTARALSSLFTVNIREACTPNRNDSLALDSFVNEGGTLYVVGESIEDPRQHPGAMPLLTALASSVVERGRRMAERSSSGRLDPPLTFVLDDVAAVAPLPQLPDLLTAGPAQGLPTLALLRSREQARSRWPQYELPV
ncbi:type IV secretory system conjugative DNA transfer family protein [Streptomyces sp. Ru72]|uniref:type IV secretory system conjugative DNA transfer family protein n=1 Tax=Streptomyces sp. Ru72 TaxID=2080747 RepID=UPI000CDD957C|nr:type IV secretory system conjugative DNA transfer family protein [Streptomyces sp. Ru72]POX44487.1 type VI secretion protein [Streptomyces sp. Ru72]